MKNISSIHFDGTRIISAKVSYWVVFQKYLTFHRSRFSLILIAKRLKITNWQFKLIFSLMLSLNHLSCTIQIYVLFKIL